MTSNPPSIVVGLDGSTSSEQGLRWAADYAAATGGRLVLVSAWEWPTFEGVPIMFGRYDPRKAARALLDRAAVTSGLPADRITSVVTRGPAAHALLEQAHDADLLVLGTGVLGTVARHLLGSVAQQCLLHAPCAVVVVPAPKRATAVVDSRDRELVSS